MVTVREQKMLFVTEGPRKRRDTHNVCTVCFCIFKKRGSVYE